MPEPIPYYLFSSDMLTALAVGESFEIKVPNTNGPIARIRSLVFSVRRRTGFNFTNKISERPYLVSTADRWDLPGYAESRDLPRFITITRTA